jgi:hypothetical protein
MTFERRRSARFRPQTEMFARLKSVLPARIVDLSLHGVQVEVTQSLQRRAELRFSLPTPEGDLVLRAAVRRCSLTGLRPIPGGERAPVYTAGLEFVEMTNEQQEVLRRVWSGLQGAAALELVGAPA